MHLAVDLLSSSNSFMYLLTYSHSPTYLWFGCFMHELALCSWFHQANSSLHEWPESQRQNRPACCMQHSMMIMIMLLQVHMTKIRLVMLIPGDGDNCQQNYKYSYDDDDDYSETPNPLKPRNKTPEVAGRGHWRRHGIYWTAGAACGVASLAWGSLGIAAPVLQDCRAFAAVSR